MNAPASLLDRHDNIPLKSDLSQHTLTFGDPAALCGSKADQFLSAQAGVLRSSYYVYRRANLKENRAKTTGSNRVSESSLTRTMVDNILKASLKSDVKLRRFNIIPPLQDPIMRH